MKSAHTKGTFLLNLSIAALSAYCLLACGSDSSSNPDFEADTDISSGDTNPSNNGSSSSKKTSSSSTVKVSSSSGISKSVFLNESLSYGELIDERDGQTYKTILIGTRYWMAENLNYKTENSYCYLEEESYCNLYGRLYTWDAAMDNNNTADSIVRGVCPQGWHLPNYEDYSILFGNVGGIRIATLKLQGSNEFHGSNQNEYGFSAAPAGYKDYSGYYAGREDGAYFWINRETGDSSAYIAQLYDGGLIRANTFYKGDVLTDWYFAEFNIVKKLNANSVRCVRDTVPGDPTITPIIWRYMPKDFPYGEMVDERDGRVYRTTTIGTQTWMAENLNYKTEHRFCLHGVPENCDRYGGLYPWGDAVDSIAEFSETGKDCGYRGGNDINCEFTTSVRGICPAGWHVPSIEDYKILFEAVGGQDSAGTMLKTRTQWYTKAGKDAFGFSAFPAGMYYKYDISTVQNTKTAFWTSDNHYRYAYFISLEYNRADAKVEYEDADYRRYLRCLKD